MPQSFSLEGKNAVVTGGSRNMGREMALALAEAGADVAIVDLPSQEAEAIGVIGEIKEWNRRGLSLPLDIRDVDAIRAQVAALVEEFGHLDILINNAGKTDGNGPFLDYEEVAFNDMQSIGLRGTFFMSQAVARHMVEQGIRGSIIHIASRLAVQVKGNSSAYSAVKAGIAHLGRSMALELGTYGIRVNSIGLGPIPRSDVKERWDSQFLLGKGLRYDDLVGTVVYLASDASRMVTGQTIIIDGGIGLSGIEYLRRT